MAFPPGPKRETGLETTKRKTVSIETIIENRRCCQSYFAAANFLAFTTLGAIVPKRHQSDHYLEASYGINLDFQRLPENHTHNPARWEKILGFSKAMFFIVITYLIPYNRNQYKLLDQSVEKAVYSMLTTEFLC